MLYYRYMKNINNIKLNKFIFGLGILAIFIFGVASMPSDAYARTYTTSCGEGGCNYVFISPRLPATTVASPTPTVYSNSTGPKTTTVKKAPAVKKTSTVKMTSTAEPVPTEQLGNLSANALYGANSFMPSGLVQWILLAILILIIVILFRKITGAEDRYHATPLKHA